MGFDFSKVTEWLNLKPRFWFGIFLLTGTILFLPLVALEKLGLKDFRDAQQTWIGLAFLGSTTLLFSYAAEEVWTACKTAYLDRKQLKSWQKQMTDLSPSEKHILREYIDNKETTRYYEISDGIIHGLIAKKILYRASDIGTCYKSFSFNMQPWAWKYLNESPEVLSDMSLDAQSTSAQQTD